MWPAVRTVAGVSVYRSIKKYFIPCHTAGHRSPVLFGLAVNRTYTERLQDDFVLDENEQVVIDPACNRLVPGRRRVPHREDSGPCRLLRLSWTRPGRGQRLAGLFAELGVPLGGIVEAEFAWSVHFIEEYADWAVGIGLRVKPR